MPQECHVMSIKDSALTSLGNISSEMDTARREEQYTENNHPAVNMQRAYAPGAAGIMFSLHNQITKTPTNPPIRYCQAKLQPKLRLD